MLAAETRSRWKMSCVMGPSGLVCTSSLELGIDAGSVRRIVQVHLTKSVDRMLQLAGADHRLGGWAVATPFRGRPFARVGGRGPAGHGGRN